MIILSMHVTGLPCNEDGSIYLTAGTPPSPRTTAPFDCWAPFEDRIQFELAEFLYKREQMSGKNISILMELWAADVARYGGQTSIPSQ